MYLFNSSTRKNIYFIIKLIFSFIESGSIDSDYWQIGFHAMKIDSPGI